MLCTHFDAGRCLSCSWLGTPYGAQLAEKQRHVEQRLAVLDRAGLGGLPELGDARVELAWKTDALNHIGELA